MMMSSANHTRPHAASDTSANAAKKLSRTYITPNSHMAPVMHPQMISARKTDIKPANMQSVMVTHPVVSREPSRRLAGSACMR